jgi:hypothetical protein
MSRLWHDYGLSLTLAGLYLAAVLVGGSLLMLLLIAGLDTLS